MNEHHYNRNLYLIMRTSSIFLVLCLSVIGGAATFYSAKGVIYNPIFRLPAWFINNALGKTVIPSSTAEFSRLYNIPYYYGFVDIIVGGFYLFMVFILTAYLALFLIIWIYSWLNHYCLVYKLGTEGARAYEKEQQEKLQRQSESAKSLSDLESAQYEHWVQWKKFYKSELSFEEWQKKVINK